MKSCVVWIWMLVFAGSICWAAEVLPLRDTMDRINYSVGYQIGGDFKKQKLEMRTDALMKGVHDALKSSKPLMTKGEMKLLLLDLKKTIVAEQNTQRKKYRQEGQGFLDANAQNDGVVELPSGLQYKVLQTGTGKSPGVSDTVKAHYLGHRIDGQQFINTYKKGEPATFKLTKAIPGWQEALQLMKVGDKWELVIPPKLGFDEKTPLADQVVIFEVELLEIFSAGQ